MARRSSRLDEAAQRLNESLAPNLHAAPIWNAVAISFFAPQKTFGEAMEEADAIDQLRRATSRPPTTKKSRGSTRGASSSAGSKRRKRQRRRHTS